MATEINEEKLNSLPVLWEDESGKIRLVRRDKDNLEIIKNQTIGNNTRGRKALEIRDSWVSIPSYHSNLKSAFRKLLEMKAEDVLIDSGNNIEKFRNVLLEFQGNFFNTVKEG